MAALRQSATLASTIRLAVRLAAGKPGSWGEVVEDEVGALLLDPTRCRQISQEAVVLARKVQLRDVPAITGLRIEAVPGTRKSVDFLAIWEHADGETVVPVNLKVTAKALGAGRRVQTSDLALSLREFLRYIMLPDYSLLAPTKEGPSSDELLLGLLSGARRLVPGRDYYILKVRTDGTTVKAWSFHGLLSQLDRDGRLAIKRHASRDNVLYKTPAGLIPDDFDIKTELVLALLPAASVATLRLALVAAAPASMRRTLAVRLAQVPDEELPARLLRGLQ